MKCINENCYEKAEYGCSYDDVRECEYVIFESPLMRFAKSVEDLKGAILNEFKKTLKIGCQYRVLWAPWTWRCPSFTIWKIEVAINNMFIVKPPIHINCRCMTIPIPLPQPEYISEKMFPPGSATWTVVNYE